MSYWQKRDPNSKQTLNRLRFGVKTFSRTSKVQAARLAEVPFSIPVVPPPTPQFLQQAKAVLNDISSKICHQAPLLPESPGVGRASAGRAGGRGGRGAAGRLAGVPGRGGGRGRGAGGGEAACREQPRAGWARRARAPARAGRGREEPRAAAASAGGAAGPPHSPPAPPRSLALTPGRRRRAARAPPAPHGRLRHGALRPPRRCPARFSAPRRGKGEGARGH